jgi:hypothetical protein
MRHPSDTKFAKRENLVHYDYKKKVLVNFELRGKMNTELEWFVQNVMHTMQTPWNEKDLREQ